MSMFYLVSIDGQVLGYLAIDLVYGLRTSRFIGGRKALYFSMLEFKSNISSPKFVALNK